MPAQILRPYQQAAVRAVMDATDPFADPSYHRVLMTLATGLGKTTIAAEIIRLLLERKERVLFLAHRKELIEQSYKRIRDQCGLNDMEIGVEQAQLKADHYCQVIVGSNQTVSRATRLNGWRPTWIVQDEGHHAAASATYQNVYERFGVTKAQCGLILMTATAKRTDRQSLYAIDINGNAVLLAGKNGDKPKKADPSQCVADRHVFEYGILEGVEEGWLVPLLGRVVETETDLNEVKTVAGDFVQKQLAKTVDNNRRTLLAINAWKDYASDRPTLVFCASVEHAFHSADLWNEAGFKAAAIEGKTDPLIRAQIFKDFHEGRLQVLCNVGIATEGVDIPRCACVICLRPTKSWTLYVQQLGRGTRVLPGTVDHLQDARPEIRREAIELSAKSDCLVIDMVDLYAKCGELCTVPSILDLPVQLNLEGHSVTEAKKLLDEFDDVKDRVIGECPTTFTRLDTRLRAVNLMLRSGADSVAQWRSTEEGYRMVGVPPGFSCVLLECLDGYRFQVTTPDGTGGLTRHTVADTKHGMQDYLDKAHEQCQKAISAWQEAHPKSRGTLSRLTPKQLKVLRYKHTDSEIDGFTYGYAKIRIGEIIKEWYG